MFEGLGSFLLILFLEFGGFFRKCFADDLFMNDVCLEYSCFVVGEHSTVKEKLRQSKIHHPVVLSDDWFSSLVYQRVILISQFEKHPL